MTRPLPPHIARAREPIPELDRADHLERDLPDMRGAAPIAQMMGWLHPFAADHAAYIKLWRARLATIGNSVSLEIDKAGERRLWFGGPVDPQVRHRSRWMHFLLADMDRDSGRRELLIAQLQAEGRYSDNRPAEPRATTRAIRDFLRCGGRIMIDPEGKLTAGAGIPHTFVTGTDDEAQECLRASRTYFEVRRRWRSEAHILRAIRILGTPTANGWIVLERKAAVEAAERVPA